MEENVHFHAQTALSLDKGHSVSTEKEVGRAPEPFWTHSGEEKDILPLSGIEPRLLGLSSQQPVHYTT
jgi:hypothetical protein